jgi:ATP/ADP translocase
MAFCVPFDATGAEVIPFLKTYVQLPGAILFTILYSKMCNTMTPDKVNSVPPSKLVQAHFSEPCGNGNA